MSLEIPEPYDSTQDTWDHIERVQFFLGELITNLVSRSNHHDFSKFSDAEKPYFDATTLRLKELPYGTPEYLAALEDIKPAIDHHYSVNDHHPQHFSPTIDATSFRLRELCAQLGEEHPLYSFLEKTARDLESSVRQMDLLQICEMLADWRASSERTKGGNISKSIDFNEQRFDIHPVLADILRNTARRYFSPHLDENPS